MTKEQFSICGDMYGLCDFTKYNEKDWENHKVYPAYTKIIQKYLKKGNINVKYKGRKVKILPFIEDYLCNPFEEENYWTLYIMCEVNLRKNETLDTNEIYVECRDFLPHEIYTY